MNKIVLGIVIVLALIIVGLFFLFSPTGMFAPIPLGTMNQNQNDTVLEGSPEPDSPAASTGMPVVPGIAGETPVPEMLVAQSVVITYTANGFEPKTITINAGDAIIFKNESGRGMWIGSDNHPTHTIYPEKSVGDCLGSSFDACRSYVPGDSWSFTFDSKGSWGYHNHVQASHRGTIIVE